MNSEIETCDIIKYAKDLWIKLGNVPIDEYECIELGFLHFPPGTERENIWHWFEAQFPITVHELMYGVK